MMTCPSCQAQLLEYVYGLLDASDPAEAATLTELRAHLETCASCQAAYERTKKQQHLLGQASRVKTELSFTAPKAEPRHVVQVRQRSSTVVWYVTVASLLFAMLGGMGSAYWYGKVTKVHALEEARLQLNTLRSRAAPNTQWEVTLKQQLASTRAETEKLAKVVKDLESTTQKRMLDNTTYQQALVPTMVPANNDAPVAIFNQTLSDKPAPLNELNSNIVDSSNKNALTQQYRRAPSNSNKMLMTLPSLAYSNQAGKNINYDFSQDVTNRVLGYKMVHPLQVLHAELSAHLCTDKPLYQPGEEIFFRGLAVDKTDFTPVKENLEFTFHLKEPGDKTLKIWTQTAQLIDPISKQALKDVKGQTIRGVGGHSFVLPGNAVQGEYQLALSEKSNKFAPQIVKFMVNSLSSPQFDKQLQFTRASYAPGDQVTLTGQVKLPNQQPWRNGNIKAEVLIDGMKYDAKGGITQDDFTASTDAGGKVNLTFSLPRDIKQGQGTLSLKLQGSDGIETWSHPIRIETGMISIDCFPEGGDLIAGTSNYLYFQLRNQNGEAVDGEAELLDQEQRVLQTVATFHDETDARSSRGMGVFSFTPQNGKQYSLRMKKPASAQASIPLPASKPSGVAMHIGESVLDAGAPLKLGISNMGKSRDLAVSVYCRGVPIALDRVRMGANVTQSIVIEAIKPLGGVYRVTIAEIIAQNNGWKLAPLAERLVYCKPSKTLQLQLNAVPSQQGQPARLRVESRNESSQNCQAYVTIIGVNKSLLELAEATTSRRLPAHFLIADEVRQPEDLEFADFFLSEHPSAIKALDLLLGVQGWRRFKEVDSPAVIDKLRKTEALPIRFYDNREQMEETVRLQIKELIENSQEKKQLIDAEKKLIDVQQQYEHQAKKHAQETAQQQFKMASAESLLKQAEEQWRLFQIWFYLGSAVVMGMVSLTGLAAMLARRAVLPLHLICTIGVLSLLGMGGTAYLWTRQPSDQQQSIVSPAGNSRESKEAADSHHFTGAKKETQLETHDLPPATAAEPAGNQVITGETAKLDQARAPMALSTKDVRRETTTAKGTMTKQPDRDRASMETARPAPSIAPSKDAFPVKPSDKLNVPGSVTSQVTKELGASAKRVQDKQLAGRGSEAVNLNRLADNRARSLVQTTAPKQYSEQAVEKLHLAKDVNLSNNPKAKVEQQPGGLMRGGGDPGRPVAPGSAGLGSGNTGGFGGGGRGSIPTPETMRPSTGNDLRKAGETVKDEMQQLNGFIIREYSWKAENKPGSLQQASQVWSKTIHWQPLAVIPSTGILELPIDLPPNEGMYRFEVFGHDGEGRLGTSSLDVPSPVQPVSFRWKLSRNQAKVGDTVQLECQVQNQTSRRQPQVMAKVQLPEGTKLPPNLKQLRMAAKAAASDDSPDPTKWYVQDRELTLIWSELAAGQRVNLTIDLICTKPADSVTSPSKAYLENQEGDAAVVPGIRLMIRP